MTQTSFGYWLAWNCGQVVVPDALSSSVPLESLCLYSGRGAFAKGSPTLQKLGAHFAHEEPDIPFYVERCYLNETNCSSYNGRRSAQTCHLKVAFACDAHFFVSVGTALVTFCAAQHLDLRQLLELGERFYSRCLGTDIGSG